MTIRHLYTFITVCELKSISEAAKKLNVAQPAVSQTIADLERYYGVPLFKRINNRIYLTPEAESLCRKAREAVKSFDEFDEMAKSKEEHPSFVIGASLTIATIYLSKIIKVIKEKYGNINLSVKVNNASEIQEQIENGILDIALIEGIPSYPNMKYEILINDKLVIVANQSFIVPKEIELKDLICYPLLLREKGSYSRDYLLNNLGIDISPMLESNSNQAIISSCLDGAGLAFVPKIIVKNYLQSKKLKEIKIKNVELTAESTLVWYEKRKFSPLFAKIISDIKEIVK